MQGSAVTGFSPAYVAALEARVSSVLGNPASMQAIGSQMAAGVASAALLLSVPQSAPPTVRVQVLSMGAAVGVSSVSPSGARGGELMASQRVRSQASLQAEGCCLRW